MSDLLTAKDAARKLGVGDRTLRRWIANGIIPVWRDPLTGRQRFSVLELDDWLRTVGRDQAAKAS